LTIVEFVNSLPGMEAASCPLTVRKKKLLPAVTRCDLNNVSFFGKAMCLYYRIKK